jgi:hypothetical protein
MKSPVKACKLAVAVNPMREGWHGVNHWRNSRWLVLGAGILAIAGCYAEPATVTGLVTLDGEPLAIRDGMRGTVVFQPTAAGGHSLIGNIDAAGRYELAAGSSSVVTPSVYWVAVSAVQIVPGSDKHATPTGKRITPGKYASATDSGFRVEVVPGPNEVDLSLTSDEPEPTMEEGIEAPSEEKVGDASDEPVSEPSTTQ